ncbi:hypothetical protein FOCC_FOCC012647 [Frankliniella occidentalis]|nr:hypothetical protein FOCC_FOCC012647 [Frankliniella occidentalis]
MKGGFPVRLPGGVEDKEAKAIVLFGTCDVPAKASFLNMKGHAGYDSCPKCFVRGEKSDRTGQVMVFPHEENLLLRNDQNYQECVTNAVASKSEDRGVYGPTILSYIVYSSFIRSTSIDSMHALSLGIVKQLLRLWFDSKYSNEPFSVVKFVDKFSKEFERLYGVRHMSSNIHLLRHLAASVVDCGNLCLTSCFKFEDLNGIKCKDAKNYCMKLVNRKYLTLSEKISDNVHVV